MIDEDPDESFSVARKMLRETLTRFLTTGNQNILRIFCKWCDQPKKAEPYLAFKDKCLQLIPGKKAVAVKQAPEVNCYAYVDESIKYKPPAADVDRYDLMMATLYGNDVESKEIEGLGEALALMYQRQPPRVRVRKGKGQGSERVLVYVGHRDYPRWRDRPSRPSRPSKPSRPSRSTYMA